VSTLGRRRLLGGILIRFTGGFLWQTRHWQVHVCRTAYEMPVDDR
jgi:hypothetical protein